MGSLWVFAGAVCLSFAAPFVAWADLGPTAVGFYRFAVATALLLVWAGVRRPTARSDPGGMTMVVVAGLAFALDMGVWNRSIHLIGPGLATLLANIQVLIVPWLAALLLRARAPRVIVAPGVLCLCGVASFSLGGDVAHPDRSLGVAYGLMAAASYSAYLVLLKGGADRVQAPQALKLLVICGTGTVALLIATLVLGESLVVPNLKTWAAIAGMAVVVQIGGWSLILRGMRTTSAAAAGLVLVAQPVLAIVWDTLLFGRPFGAREWVGGAIALTAIAWGSWRVNRE